MEKIKKIKIKKIKKIKIPGLGRIKIVVAIILLITSGALVIAHDVSKSYPEAILFLLFTIVLVDYVRVCWKERNDPGKWYELEDMEETTQ